jgi:hypothetical protein
MTAENEALVLATDTPSSIARKVRRRAIEHAGHADDPSTGNPLAGERHVAHCVERVGDNDQDRIG